MCLGSPFIFHLIVDNGITKYLIHIPWGTSIYLLPIVKDIQIFFINV